MGRSSGGSRASHATAPVTNAVAPRGSELRFEREGQAMVVPFGTSEALAIHLDGTGLPDDVYTRCNINELVERVDAADRKSVVWGKSVDLGGHRIIKTKRR